MLTFAKEFVNTSTLCRLASFSLYAMNVHTFLVQCTHTSLSFSVGGGELSETQARKKLQQKQISSAYERRVIIMMIY